MTTRFRLNVLNPGGRDPEEHFAEAVTPESGGHAPVNFHAYAACTGGSFLRDVTRAIELKQPVLLLLRGDFRPSERAFAALHDAGLPVAISLKETGLHQIAAQLEDEWQMSRFLRLVHEANGCIATTPEAADIYHSARRKTDSVAFIPTPYPLHDPRWDFSRPIEHRHGIFVGTREFEIPSRNHAAALLLARQLSDATGARVTVYNYNGRRGERLLQAIGFASNRLRVFPKGNKSYLNYLRVMAEHKIVLQMDTSAVPGQVAGDALLCRLPCVGGNGAIDRIAHTATCGIGRSGADLAQLAVRLLCDADFYAHTLADSQRAASEYLSFAGVARQLTEFLARIGGTLRSPRSPR